MTGARAHARGRGHRADCGCAYAQRVAARRNALTPRSQTFTQHASVRNLRIKAVDAPAPPGDDSIPNSTLGAPAFLELS